MSNHHAIRARARYLLLHYVSALNHPHPISAPEEVESIVDLIADAAVAEAKQYVDERLAKGES